jgi:hypothetical protein
MTMHGTDPTLFDGTSTAEHPGMFEMTQAESQPLGVLSEYVGEWADKEISPMAVVAALGHLVGRSLNERDTRNAVAWLEEETEKCYSGEEPVGDPADYLVEALMSFKPGSISAEEVVYSAFLRAGYIPPFPNYLDSLAQDLIDNDTRLYEGEQ